MAQYFFFIQPKVAILSDSNKELIDTYKAVRNDWKKVYNKLKRHHLNHSKAYYYKMRNASLKSPFSRAARFIYLNRTCWNGLYRVNQDGKFNVPIGTKNNVVFPNENFERISTLFRRTTLLASDFEKIINMAKSKDFLFVDPPYTVKYKNKGFLKYNEDLFKWEDQIRLRDSLVRAKKRDVIILLTNANTQSIRKLYEKDFYIHTVRRKSNISGNPYFRKICEEVIIRSY